MEKHYSSVRIDASLCQADFLVLGAYQDYAGFVPFPNHFMTKTPSSSAHTAGPYTQDENIDGLLVMGNDGLCVAIISSRNRSVAEQEANARLFIAAPELLEVVRLLLAMDIEDYSGTLTRKAKLAIAKAESSI